MALMNSATAVLLMVICLICLNCVKVQQQGNIIHLTTTLSQGREGLAATSSGELVFFGGGSDGTQVTNRVDIYNVTSGIWTTTTLSIPRQEFAATSSQNLVFFGGGWDDGTMKFYDRVDIYNTLSGSWSTSALSQPRCCLAATSVGNFVLFGGGQYSTTGYSKVVDVFNVTSNTWTATTLSQARSYLAATSVDNRYALFGGGLSGSGPLNVVDIFDSLIGTWTQSTLSQARALLAASSLGNLAFFGGGFTQISIFGMQVTESVEIYNPSTNSWTSTTLSQARGSLAASSFGEIVAFGGGSDSILSSGFTVYSTVDMYNVTSGIWFTMTLSEARRYLVATLASNKIFFGGGRSGQNSYSNQVDIFCFGSNCPPPPQPPTSPPTPPPPTTPTSPPTSPSTTSLPTPSSVPTSPTSSTTSPTSSPSSTPPTFSNSSSPGPSPSPEPSLTQQPSVPSSNTSLFSPEFTPMNTPSIDAITNSDTLSSTALIGLVIGLAALLVGVGIILLIVLIKRRRKSKKPSQTEELQSQSRLPSQSPSQSQISQQPFENDEEYTRFREFATQTLSFSRSESSVKRSQIPYNDLSIEKELGDGSFGKVYLGRWNGAPVALKFCRKKESLEDVMSEIKIMVELPPHPNVVQMYGISIDGPQPIIIMEYCSGGSLDSLLYDKKQKLTPEKMISLVQGIARGVLHLHKHNIVHRDLAARNILLTGEGSPKISDFGMSRILERTNEGKTQSGVGPVCWMAPESLAYRHYSKASDIWSFGIVVYEIVAQREPHKDKDVFEVGMAIRDHGLTPEIPGDCPPLLRELMEKCWQKSPEHRPDIQTVCSMLEN